MSTSTIQFFGGNATSLKSVSKLSAPSWSRFVQDVLGHPNILNVTRAQFQAMPKAQRNAAKRVAYVTPAVFRTSPSVRETSRVAHCSIAALDIDDPRQARPFVSKPDLLRTALEPLPFAAYTTASSTAADPKLRILVALDRVPAAKYPDAVRTIARMLGLPTVTKESLVPVQPMYLPTIFRDDDPVDAHPLLTAALEGAPLTAAQIQSGGPGTVSSSSKELEDSDADDLEHLRPTVEDITLEDVTAALEHVDPDCGYHEWLEVAAALRHQFGHASQTEAAYTLFDTWSRKGKKYQGKADTRAKWDSLRPTPRGRVPVTVRSLLRRATDGGWKGGATVGERVYQRTALWLEDRARSQHDLMTEGVRRIAGAPLLTGMERTTLLARLRDALHKHHHLKVTTADLRKELRRLERAADKSATAARPESDTVLAPWARGVCYVAATNEFFQRAVNRAVSPEVLDNMYGVQLMTADNDSGRPSIRPRDYLLNVARIPRVDHYRYDPANGENTFITDPTDGKRYVNLYLPTYPEPDADDAAAAGKVFHHHLSTLIKEPEYRAIAMDYLAFCVQHPGVKIRWAWLLQGAQGAGKTAVAEAMRAVLGASNVSIMDASLLFTPFNGWATGAQFITMEEVRIVGHNRHEIMNRLKPCVSNDTIVINRKNRDLQQVPNISNYLLLTNHVDSLSVTPGDRRYFVVNSALQDREQVRALGPQYFTRLFHTIHKQSAGLRAWFEQHRIRPTFDPNGHAPATVYLQDLTVAASSPLTAAVREALEDGPHALVRRDVVSTRCLKVNLDNDQLPRYTDQHLAASLRELGYACAGRLRLGEDRHYIWHKREVRNPLAVAGQRWAAKDEPVLT